MKKLIERLKPLKPIVGILAKGGAKLFPVTNIIPDLIDNWRARKQGLPAPHSIGSVYVAITGFLCITTLLLFRVVTVQDIIDLMNAIGSLFTGGEAASTVNP